MTVTTNGGNGDGYNGGFDDTDDFIRDRDDDPLTSDPGWDDPAAWDPRAAFGSAEGFAGGRSKPRSSGIDHALIDAVARLLDGLTGVADDALPSHTRHQLERALRDLLIVLRDVIDAIIERIDGRHDEDHEIEEIPID